MAIIPAPPLMYLVIFADNGAVCQWHTFSAARSEDPGTLACRDATLLFPNIGDCRKVNNYTAAVKLLTSL